MAGAGESKLEGAELDSCGKHCEGLKRLQSGSGIDDGIRVSLLEQCCAVRIDNGDCTVVEGLRDAIPE